MDPRYGEISRAMRNRGVEIFMLGEVCWQWSEVQQVCKVMFCLCMSCAAENRNVCCCWWIESEQATGQNKRQCFHPFAALQIFSNWWKESIQISFKHSFFWTWFNYPSQGFLFTAHWKNPGFFTVRDNGVWTKALQNWNETCFSYNFFSYCSYFYFVNQASFWWCNRRMVTCLMTMIATWCYMV